MPLPSDCKLGMFKKIEGMSSLDMPGCYSNSNAITFGTALQCLATEELPKEIQHHTCHYVTEQRLPQGFVLAPKQPEEQRVQLCCCKLHSGHLSAGR